MLNQARAQCCQGHWAKGYSLSRQAVFKEAGVDPSDYPGNEMALMNIVSGWCDLVSDNFSQVFAKYPEGNLRKTVNIVGYSLLTRHMASTGNGFGVERSAD